MLTLLLACVETLRQSLLGLVLIVVCVVISFFQDNDVEAWVRASFWGNWPLSWEGASPPQATALQRAKAMAHGDRDLAAFLKAELEGYANLTWALRVVNTDASDQYFEIVFPGFTDSPSTRATSIRVNSLERAFLGTTSAYSVNILERRFIGQNTLRAKIEQPSQAALDKIYAARIVVSYPRTTGGTFRAELMERRATI